VVLVVPWGGRGGLIEAPYYANNESSPHSRAVQHAVLSTKVSYLQIRLRFHCEVLSAVLEAVGGSVPVGIRISQTKVNNFEYQWPGQEQDAKEIFSALKSVGPTYIHISTHKGLEEVWKSGRHLADWAKEIWGGPTIACGGLHDPIHAEKLLKEGKADFIAIGKGALADPEWPKKVSADLTPTAFDPGMIKPYANLQNTLDWRENNTH